MQHGHPSLGWRPPLPPAAHQAWGHGCWVAQRCPPHAGGSLLLSLGQHKFTTSSHGPLVPPEAWCSPAAATSHMLLSLLFSRA